MRSSPRSVSVVMPTRNVAETVGGQLAALAAQTYTGDWELVVADNGSTDDTAPVLHRWADRIPHLRVVDAVRPTRLRPRHGTQALPRRVASSSRSARPTTS